MPWQSPTRRIRPVPKLVTGDLSISIEFDSGEYIRQPWRRDNLRHTLLLPAIMAPPPSNGTSNTVRQDYTIPLVNASAATTTIAVNVRPLVLTFARTLLTGPHSQN